MTPEDLRATMPACESVAYLNSGAGSPTPRPVVEAVQAAVAHQGIEAPAGEGQYPAAMTRYEDARESLAGFLGVSPAEIALTQSTTDGINRVATAVPWTRGDDTVVRTDLEHSSGVLPWRRLADTRGLDVRVVDTDRGRLDPAAFGDAVRESGASLAVLSAVDWGYGRRLPVAEAVAAAQDAGARVLVDAVQATGQFPLAVDEWGAAFVATAGHKWLLGPWGAGALYVDRDALDWLEPERVGYRSVVDPNAANYQFHDGARRLEVGTVDPAPHVGLAEALDLLEDVGLDTVTSRVERLTDRLKAGLPEGTLAGPREYQSGLVSFRTDDPDGLVERLDEAGVVVRKIPATGTVRASVHVFNTADDVDRLLDVVAMA
ncbi:MAG: aminotransferase class V-fold PLP-dependent enzyme [Halobacteriaceae archaeon]